MGKIILQDRLDFWLNNTKDNETMHQEAFLHLIQTSEYASGILLKHQQTAELIIQDLKNSPNWANYDFSKDFQEVLNSSSESELMQNLRIRKQIFDCRLISAVVNQNLDQVHFLQGLSNLAASVINCALRVEEKFLQERFGVPCDEKGNSISLIVFAMGKLGGRELNFSSDIDLIFAYAESGQTKTTNPKQKSIDNETFFRKLAQKLIYALDHNDEYGFCYRVDMRLRPFGQTGPLVLSLDAMENYYQIHGRDWERYAMMKASVIAGDIKQGESFLSNIRPFIYRRYLDYAALESIKQMKQSINRQISDIGMQNHIKLGRGGIREAEFSVQAVQMIYGGQFPKIQNNNFLTALKDINDLNLWEHGNSQDLSQAYLFLRCVENALQFDRAQQTHNLPDTEHAWQRLALALGFSDVEKLKSRLDHAKNTIHDIFRRIFPSPQINDEANNLDELFVGINWQNPAGQDICKVLQYLQTDNNTSEQIALEVQNFAINLAWNKLPVKTVKRIEQLLPNLLEAAANNQANDVAVKEILDLIISVSTRSVYIEMLSSNPSMLKKLLTIAKNCKWLMSFIREHPLVIDDILSGRNKLPNRQELEHELSARLENLDEEEWINAMRDFKHAQVFKIAWAEINENLSLMIASDRLTTVAELLIEKASQKAISILQDKYGIPMCNDGSKASFAIAGYGKLGGYELSYGSDLDLVFIYDDKRSQGSTNGEKSIANQVFFTRLVQRITSYLSSSSTSGILYQIDTRLRPGGNSGMPVVSIERFYEYQLNQAWTWEHQALTRARSITGDPELCQYFEKAKREILRIKPKENLRDEVLNMRKKMHETDDQTTSSQFHLKKSAGGLVDIEFIVQYLLLKHSHKEEVLIRNTDNIRQLAALEAVGIISSLDAMTLRDSYRALRRSSHLKALNMQNLQTDPNEWKHTIRAVKHIWNKIFELEST